MTKLSQNKREKISEQILSVLFESFPKPLFTSNIARELARDEDFIKSLLHELQEKKLIVKINKNPQGIKYSRRLRWRLANKTHLIYSNNYSI